MQPLEPNTSLSVHLTAEQWNVVLGHLDTGQHRIVRPIIDIVMQQLRQQSMPAPSATEDMIAAQRSDD